MKIALFFFLLPGLTAHCAPVTCNLQPLDSLILARHDSTGKSATDSVHATRPDSVTSEPAAPAIQLAGEVTLSTGFYAMTGLEAPRAQAMPWSLSGNLTINTRSGWNVPVRLVWSSQNNQYRQPYNQLGASPRYKDWLTLHAGYRNIVFSPLTLAGHTFLGVGLELNPGLLRVGAIVGKFNRAIDASYADPDQVATFLRTGYSIKLGVGNQQNYLDLIVLRVADDLFS
ncbi:MAG TPA: hypothetical protein VGB67_06245, partial [Fibrella sp.]